MAMVCLPMFAQKKNKYNEKDFRCKQQIYMSEKEAYIPEPEVNLWTRIKPWLYMTAMFVGIMLSVRIFVGEPQKEDFPISVAEAESLSDEEWEIIASNAMVHNYSLYEFLTETEN